MRNKIKEPTERERRVIKIMVLLGIFSILNFLFFFFDAEHWGNLLLFSLLGITILYSAFKKLYMWYNYSNISIPETPRAAPDLKVDILTTYFPGEPYQMIVTTLEAITKITYPHTAYLCDEANDPFLKSFCEENGIVHVTRDNRKDAKAGNINNALQTAARGDICVVLDPDHIPEPDFLDPIIPHFSNPEIGFVQIVQSYYNTRETLVAQGAAEQTFQFYGPMMMTLNAYGTVNAIGANCVFRRKALDSIGGHAPGLCEDMHTAMLLYAKGWKAVYLPYVLAKGLAPANLTTYFKQQLKWARGTFDLLVKVYPKVFPKLTNRQRIHFGILPLHYLAGVISLINFSIPILALIFASTPWEGNIVDFALVLLPVVTSALLIRTFVQKWVIEKEERGFHLVGGLLQINTWWVYILGLFYTVINKNVLYLPTPKHSEFSTNLRIVIPNLVVAVLSILAIVYGLQKDLTPFSIFMAGFAFFNALIMGFGIYLTVNVTNQNQILRANLDEKMLSAWWSFKGLVYRFFHSAFTFTRMTALPLLAVILLLSLSLKHEKDAHRWENLDPVYYYPDTGKLLGIFNPPGENGLVDFEEINLLEARQNLNFDIISFYLAWDDENVENFPFSLLHAVESKNAIPMITWEPWTSELQISSTDEELRQGEKIFAHIAEGFYDDYIRRFSTHLASFGKPLFLRFAHEFDNPAYPWSDTGKNTPEEFKAAWRHVHNILKEEGAHEVILVWNPWRPVAVEKYYPGDKFVDWIGVTALNYSSLYEIDKNLTFEELYEPFHNGFGELPEKPVMLAEFGSLNHRKEQNFWIKDALKSISEDFPEISAIVLFNSAYDKNIPQNTKYQQKYLNWATDSLAPIAENFDRTGSIFTTSLAPFIKKYPPQPVTDYHIRGVRYKKGRNWKDNYYVLTKKVLERDFRKMKDAGINTIQFRGGNIYDYNRLKYANEHGMQVIYGFDIPFAEGILENEEQLRELREEIIASVQEFADNEEVIAYSIPMNLQEHYENPLLFYKRRKYFEWLQTLLQEIKRIDPFKSVVADIPLDSRTTYLIREIDHYLPIDSYGLTIEKEADNWNRIKTFTSENGFSIFISAISAEVLLENPDKFSSEDIVLRNWQNERLSTYITFDGLTDFEGRAKNDLRNIADAWSLKKASPIDTDTVEIMKPAVPLLAGGSETYHAVLYKNGEWISDFSEESSFKFEWKLVKNDIFGNPLAYKELGEGPAISVSIPEDYKEYELLLTAVNLKENYVITTRSQLHTPLDWEPKKIKEAFQK